MFHVIDHNEVVFTGEFSQSTQYVMDHYDRSLDEAIHAGIRILYADSPLGLHEARQDVRGSGTPDFWKPVDDWMLD